MIRFFTLIIFLFSFHFNGNSQIKILFDNTKAESAGSADWVIDADLHNLGFGTGPALLNKGTESNAQRIPTPLQSTITSSTVETYWEGGLSFWAIDCVNKGYTVESLPYNVPITYGNSSNPQDLSNYKVYIVCEPNILFTAAEKTAIMNFVAAGGGLFMISDHTVSDRNNDGYDSPMIWNDLIQNNGTGNANPFGITFDLANISNIYSTLAPLPATDSILYGSMGTVSKVKWSNGTTMTINTTANPTTKAVIYKTGASGNTGVLVAYARYGAGKIVAMGDSSPCDDGTGDPNDALYTGYNVDVAPNHRNLIMNSTIWLAASDSHTYIFTGNGNWNVPSNWINNLIPPSTLPANDSILINNLNGGQCILNITQQQIAKGATLDILPGKNLLIPGVLTIQ